MIAGTGSGCGKTTVTCGLLAALKKRGEPVASLKSGPDYIDPLFHREILGIPGSNLDTWFTDEEETRNLFFTERSKESLTVAEGVMGLYDGAAGIEQEGSSYHLASVLKMPVILVADGRGKGRSLIAEIAGFLQYDKEHLIQGVILNRTSDAMKERLSPIIRRELGIEVLGAVPFRKEKMLESRYLGLSLEEKEKLKAQAEEMACTLENHIDVGRILQIAESAADPRLFAEGGKNICRDIRSAQTPVRIGVARDAAFCFYYRENLDLLKSCGAELVFFSPLEDDCFPPDLGGLYLGGGYPELYAGKLEQNKNMREAVREALSAGMPCIAECGGFLYLHRTYTDGAGKEYSFAGALDADCRYAGRSLRFGYASVREKEKYFLDSEIRGHEFHYCESSDPGESCTAVKPITGMEYPCIHKRGAQWLGFMHLYFPSAPEFVERWLSACRNQKTSRLQSGSD